MNDPSGATEMAHAEPKYSRIHRAAEIASIVIFVSYAVGCLWRIFATSLATGPSAFLAIGVAGLLGYVAADFISGTVHWLADRYGSRDLFLLGPNFIGPFRDHHVRPKEITQHDFVETNGNNCMISFWVLMLVYHAVPLAAGDLTSLFIASGLTFSMAAIMATNQFHKWAHSDSAPRLVRLLQRWHVILPADHHDVHHRAPFATYFCITTGWLNWPLRKLRFYESVEGLVHRLTGIRPGEDDAISAGLVPAPAPEVPVALAPAAVVVPPAERASAS